MATRRLLHTCAREASPHTPHRTRPLIQVVHRYDARTSSRGTQIFPSMPNHEIGGEGGVLGFNARRRRGQIGGQGVDVEGKERARALVCIEEKRTRSHPSTLPQSTTTQSRLQTLILTLDPRRVKAPSAVLSDSILPDVKKLVLRFEPMLQPVLVECQNSSL